MMANDGVMFEAKSGLCEAEEYCSHKQLLVLFVQESYIIVLLYY